MLGVSFLPNPGLSGTPLGCLRVARRQGASPPCVCDTKQCKRISHTDVTVMEGHTLNQCSLTGVAPLPRGHLGHLQGVLGFRNNLEPLQLAFRDRDEGCETRYILSSVSAPTSARSPSSAAVPSLNIAGFRRIKPADFLSDRFGHLYAGQPDERVLLQTWKWTEDELHSCGY